MTTFSELKNAADTPSLVRKALEGVIFLRRKTPGETIPAAILDAEKQPIDLKSEGYFPVGVMSTDGITWGREVEKSEVEGFGYGSPVRTDIIKAPKTVAFTALESDRRELAEILYGMDLSQITAGTNGEIVFDEPSIPSSDEYEGVVLSRDGSTGTPYFRGAGLPRIKLANVDDEVWQAQDPRKYPFTFDVLTDDVLGTPMRHYIGGAAFDAVAQGFKAAV